MKHSLKKIIDQFESYPREIHHFLSEILILENEKIDQQAPQVINQISNELDKLVDSYFSEKSEKS